MAHPLETIMQSTVAELRDLAGVETVVGTPISVGEHRMILPVSRVSVGFVSGGAEYGVKNPVLPAGLLPEGGGRLYPFAGTLTAGVSITPVAFLTVTEDRIGVLPADESEPYAKILQLLPELVDKARELLESVKRSRRQA